MLSAMTSKMGACGSAAVTALLTARSRVSSRACVDVGHWSSPSIKAYRSRPEGCRWPARLQCRHAQAAPEKSEQDSKGHDAPPAPKAVHGSAHVTALRYLVRVGVGVRVRVKG